MEVHVILSEKLIYSVETSGGTWSGVILFIFLSLIPSMVNKKVVLSRVGDKGLTIGEVTCLRIFTQAVVKGQRISLINVSEDLHAATSQTGSVKG